MGFWFELANSFSFGALGIIRNAMGNMEKFNSKILEYIDEINKAAEEDATCTICKNLSNSLYEFSEYVMNNYKSKSNDTRSIKEGTFKWRVASILRELDSAWQENEESLKKKFADKADKSKKLLKEAAQRYISKKRAYNALKFLTMEGNKRSYWNNDFCKKIKIPEKFINEEKKNKK